MRLPGKVARVRVFGFMQQLVCQQLLGELPRANSSMFMGIAPEVRGMNWDHWALLVLSSRQGRNRLSRGSCLMRFHS